MANYLDPYAAELQGIQRQQKLAEMLMNQPQPQEQMVSGRVAPINPLQAFLPALNTYQGMNLQKNAEVDTKKLADLVRGKKVEEVTQFFDAFNKNPQEAIKMGALSDEPFLQTAASALLNKKPEKTILPKGATLLNDKNEVVASGAPEHHAPIQIDAGTHIELRDPNDPSKVIAKIPKVKEYAPHAPQLIPTENGLINWNPNTKVAEPVLINGKPVMGKNALNETQAKASMFQGIMLNSTNEMNNLENAGFDPTSFKNQATLKMGGTSAGNTLMPPEAQGYKQASDAFANAYIRFQSGAGINQDEIQRNLKNMMPSLGDKPETIAQKQRARIKAIELMGNVAGSGNQINNPTLPTIPKTDITNNGKIPTFASESEAQKAGVKKGTRIIINGVAGIWE
jgi:hypothetical protein